MDTQTKVQVISRITIKPSIPTPHSNRNIKLSLLDQIYPPVYHSSVLFYTSSDTFSISNTLQKSMSETLVQFYPFAGRVKENSYIDCSDQGACFVEAKAECKLSDFLRKPDLDLLRQFLPILLLNDSGHHHSKALATNTDDHGEPITLVQLTFFSCGGLAIGVSVLHKIGDAMSVLSFVKSWSSVTRGNPVVALPDFVGPCLLPPLEDPPVLEMRSTIDFPGWSPRRFVFDTSKLTSLKAELANIVKFKPSDVELVSAILFKRLLAASGRAALEMVVNLRRKMDPPLLENTVGNHIFAVPVLTDNKDDSELPEFVSRMRKELIEFYDKKANKFKGEDGIEMVCGLFKDKAELWMKGLSVYTISSVCKFPIYETDFGMGKPAWVTCPMLFPWYVLLTDTKSGDGIEVWATLEDRVMAILEQDEELLAFASLNPSVSTCGGPSLT